MNRKKPKPVEDYAPPARSIGEVIPAIMKRMGLEEQHWMTELSGEWDKIVGEDVARHTRPGKVQGDALVVFVDNSVWLNELSRYGKVPMLANLKKRFGSGKIDSLRFQLDPDAG